MNEFTRGQLLKELASRGYRDDGSSPFRSIVLDYDELAEIELGELLEQMVVRREKIFRSIDAVGCAIVAGVGGGALTAAESEAISTLMLV